MYRRLWTVCLGLGVLVMTIAGCEAQSPTGPSGLELGSGAALPAAGIGATLPTGGVLAQMGPLDRPQTWVDGELFAGVVTPATFDPESDPFDELYSCGPGGGFLNGVPLISDSRPGDQDYNGGRWHLNLITNPADCASKYAAADRDGDLTAADFTSTDMYFECPLLPRRGNNP